MKNFTPFFHLRFLVPFLLATVLMISCKNKDQPALTDKLLQKEEDPNSRLTDFLGAMEYEYNMLKNPTTGTIPEGIRDAELLQAKQLLAQQLQNPVPDVPNSYSFQGPNNLGGRTRGLAYDVRNGTSNSVIMAGGISGGVYKSTDDGATWVRKSPTGDLFNVSALAQDTRAAPASARDTWYYGGGEFTGNSASGTGASYRGKGVYKSTDNGETWALLPNSNTGVYEVFDHRADYIYKLVVDPTNGNVYMAAADAIYRSIDGGTTWGIVLT
ncbi:MAG TPA: sialidase family protein, partial [Chitinophagaceae bacterium]|nr:sialidase family protein [Chitinophagaceae bacterium]